MRLRQNSCRAGGRVRLPLGARAALAALALIIAACNQHDPTVTGSIPAAPPVATTAARTIAFESIDGPPRPVFDRLVAALEAEAGRRELPVVTHTGPSAYRVRAYLATYIEKKKKRATLTWTWEVLDTRENRTFRLGGEEPLGAPRSDAWAQVDEALLKRIAAEGFERLSGRIEDAPPKPPSSREMGPAIAFAGPQ